MTAELNDPTLSLAATVADTLTRAGIDSALIGAAALAVHNYPRATAEGLDIRVVDLSHLIALKLYAGGPKSSNDVIGLLEANEDADLAAIKSVCDGLGLGQPLRRLLASLGQ